MKIGGIGTIDTITLLRLAGVKYCAVAEDVSTQFDEIAKDVDILIIDYETAEKIRDKILYFRLMHDKPVIVEIPGKKGKEMEDTIRKIIVRAVGVDIGD